MTTAFSTEARLGDPKSGDYDFGLHRAALAKQLRQFADEFDKDEPDILIQGVEISRKCEVDDYHIETLSIKFVRKHSKEQDNGETR